MPLTTKERQALKAAAHGLKPVVILGNKGLTQPVIAEIDRALVDHELIKVKVPGTDREQRQAILQEVCETLGAESVQIIGNIGVLYRENPTDD